MIQARLTTYCEDRIRKHNTGFAQKRVPRIHFSCYAALWSGAA